MIQLEFIITDKNDSLERISGLSHGLVQQRGKLIKKLLIVNKLSLSLY